MEKNSNFFNSQGPSSYVKTKIVSTYFPQYCKILLNCKILLKNPQPEIRYIDLFSGPGIYDDGHESTPLMIADECYRNDQLRAIVRMQFNDKNYKEILEKNFLENFREELLDMNLSLLIGQLENVKVWKCICREAQ